MTARKKFKNKVRGQQAKMGASYRVALDALGRGKQRPTEPFGAWLVMQADREDPIGDLANDVDRDPQFHRGSVREAIEHLSLRGPHVRSALAEAILEWRALTRGGAASIRAKAKRRDALPRPPRVGQRYRREDGAEVSVEFVNVDAQGNLVWVSTSDGACVWASAWPTFMRTSEHLAD